MVNQITADELADRLDDGEALALFDTRPADSFESWHLPGAVNVPYDPREGLDQDDFQRIRDEAADGHVTAICGKGLTSTPFAFELEDHGYVDVTVVKGGMEDWGALYEAVPIETATGGLVVRQVQRRGKGCLGYVVGDERTGAAAAVDPTRRIDAVEVAAEEAGLTIERVIDTHVHADHLSGGRALADALDVPYHLGERASDRDVTCDYEPVADGDELAVGDVTLRAIDAPGHTTEMVNYLVADELLLSSDTLFVESVGRTELQFGDEGAAEGARLLYETLHEKLLALPDETVVLPGHVSVSAENRFAHGEPGAPIRATIGDLVDDLDLLSLDEDAFVDRLTADVSAKPANYEEIIAINACREALPETQEAAAELEIGPNNCAA